MQYRINGDNVQLLKTVTENDKTRSQRVGSINLETRAVKLKEGESLSTDEQGEVDRWLDRQATMRGQQEQLALQTLPEQMQRAARWLKANPDDPAASELSEELRFATRELNGALGKSRA